MAEYKNILIVGAGVAGQLLKKDIEKNHPECRIIGFVDDELKGNKNFKVLGGIDDLSKINKIYKANQMIIAIPSAGGKLVRRILLNNLHSKIPIKIVPREQKTINFNYVKYKNISDLGFEDFLGRPFKKTSTKKLTEFYGEKKVLITGGAGSIGSEMIKQLLDLKVKKVIVYDNSEYLIFNLDQCLKEREIKQRRYRLIIGNILNYKKLDYIIKKEKPDIVFHAAAYKHVYLMENNVDEAILNNVVGTKNVVDAVSKNKVKYFVFISTDKVVNPTSVMGATKKLCEFYIKNLENQKTKFNIVRFGNVINSNGSVLPLFERQIEENGQITVTHKKIKRFFMSIKEAAQLVIMGAAYNAKGDINILNMGELVNIHEAAQCLIRSKNLMPDEDIKIKIIGLKKGEKLIEELFTKAEKKNLLKTKVSNVYRLKNLERCPVEINTAIKDFLNIANSYQGVNDLKYHLKKIFPTLKLSK